MKIAIVGASGQLGRCLIDQLIGFGEIIPIYRVGSDYCIELENPETIGSVMHALKPDLIINAAAYTDIEGAEEDSKEAFKINANAVEALAIVAKKLQIPLIHYSTDYVFDGRLGRPYREDDQPNPLNQYGKSKLAGEQRIQAVGGDYIILRTSWLYSANGNNFFSKISKKMAFENSISVVSDQIGCPTWSRYVAKYTCDMLRYIIQNGRLSKQYNGIYHLNASGEASWYEFAKMIARYSEKEINIIPISSNMFKSHVTRPAYSVLSNEKFQKTFSVSVMNWKSMFEQFVAINPIKSVT